MKPIHVLMAATDSYAMPLAVTGHSLLEHVSKNRLVEIHVVDVDISDRNKERIEKIWTAVHLELRILWHRTNFDEFSQIDVRRYSMATLGRLMLSDYFENSVDRVLYVDCDMVVQTNIEELWNIDLSGFAVWAVRNADIGDFKNYIKKKIPHISAPDDTEYFNAGTLLVNLSEWRRQHIGHRTLDILKNHGHDLLFLDQDALNATLAGQWGRLNSKWNKQVLRIGRPEAAPFHEPGIVHFTSKKPWNPDYAQRARMVFHNAYLRSGWDPKPKALMTVARLAGTQLWTKKKGGLMRRINKIFPKKT